MGAKFVKKGYIGEMLREKKLDKKDRNARKYGHTIRGSKTNCPQGLRVHNSLLGSLSDKIQQKAIDCRLLSTHVCQSLSKSTVHGD